MKTLGDAKLADAALAAMELRVRWGGDMSKFYEKDTDPQGAVRSGDIEPSVERENMALPADTS